MGSSIVEQVVGKIRVLDESGDSREIGFRGRKKDLTSAMLRFVELSPSSSRCFERRCRSAICVSGSIGAPPRFNERSVGGRVGRSASRSWYWKRRWREVSQEILR